MKIRILEVDQWTSTGNVEDLTLDDFDIDNVRGGDSEAIRVIGIADARIREVEESWVPTMGSVWYRPGANGKLEHWKATYDSSG
ncbi:MAG: hypothetical protein AAB562_01775 [Patescibacteria group bacterium]